MIQHSVDKHIYAGLLIKTGLLLLSVVFGGYANGETTRLDEVFSRESTGRPVNRREVLLKEQDPASQWQSGRILVDGRWLDMEKLDQPVLSPRIVAYKQKRGSHNLDLEEHRAMARWCARHKLPELAEVHWKAVVAVAVDDVEARRSLKHRKVDNNWFTEQEFEQAAGEIRQEKTSLKVWMPQIRKIVTKLQSNDTHSKLEGMKALQEIDNSAAVDALKYAAMQLNSSVALPIVSEIKSLRSENACLALCEVAIHDPTSEVGRLAIEGLKEYDERYYVPELLQMLELPINVKQQLVYLPNGSLAIKRAYTRETVDAKEQLEIFKLISLKLDDFAVPQTTSANVWTKSDVANQTITTTTLRSIGFTVHGYSPRGVSATDKLASVSVRMEDRYAAILRDIQLQRQQNAKTILSEVSGIPISQPVESYWDWWPSYNESSTTEKSVSRHYAFDDSDPLILPGSATGSIELVSSETRPGYVHHKSCLVAGTPIQTTEGLKAIESIRVGDSIASMNVATGELSIRPAIHVTERTSDSSYLITVTSGETIRATGGHNWWIIGRGWQRSRQLETGQYMRTGEACVKITRIQKIDEPVQVYNMIVDQNHTYFVGKHRLLSWDVTSLEPTLQTVPGQKRTMYVKK